MSDYSRVRILVIDDDPTIVQAVIRILNREGFAYVEGLTDPFLPLPARIVSVADFFDAMTHARPYRSAISVEATLAELLRLRGRSFDPTVVDAFFQLEDPASLV